MSAAIKAKLITCLKSLEASAEIKKDLKAIYQRLEKKDILIADNAEGIEQAKAFLDLFRFEWFPHLMNPANKKRIKHLKDELNKLEGTVTYHYRSPQSGI